MADRTSEDTEGLFAVDYVVDEALVESEGKTSMLYLIKWKVRATEGVVMRAGRHLLQPPRVW